MHAMPVSIDKMIEQRLYTTVEILDLLKLLFSKDGEPASDYRIAKILDVSTTTVSRWRSGEKTMDDDTGYKVAELLGMQQEHMMGCIYYERSQRARNAKMSDLWSRIALRGTNAVALVALGFAALFNHVL